MTASFPLITHTTRRAIVFLCEFFSIHPGTVAALYEFLEHNRHTLLYVIWEKMDLWNRLTAWIMKNVFIYIYRKSCLTHKFIYIRLIQNNWVFFQNPFLIYSSGWEKISEFLRWIFRGSGIVNLIKKISNYQILSLMFYMHIL